MPRYEVVQRRKAQKDLQRRWELPPGSRVWCYLRHSPGDNQSIDSQCAGMLEWCASNVWQIERMFVDEAVEGSRDDRAQFQEMMSLARQGARAVDGIVLWSFSRFARDQLDAQFYKAELRKRGYAVLSKSDDIPANEMAPVYEAFVDWKNQRFLEDLSADVKRGLSSLVQDGYWPGGPMPIGYTAERVEIGRRHSGEPRFGLRMIQDENVAARVARAWAMKLHDNASYLEIHEATHLYSDSKHYSNFFDNLIYAGIFRYHGTRYPANWEEGGRFCEPYVSLDEFLQVQANRRKHTLAVVHPRSLSSHYLLTGLVVCGECSAKDKPTTLVGQTDNRRQDTRYYRCSTKIRARGHDCALPRIPCWRLDEAVLSVLRETVLTPEYVQSEVERANGILAETDSDIDALLAEASRLAKAQQKKVESIVELIGKKGVTPILEAQYDEANRLWLEATARVAALKGQPARAKAESLSVKEALAYLDEMLTTLTSGSMTERQALVSRFVECVEVHRDHADVKLKFRLDALTAPITSLLDEPLASVQKETGSTIRSPRQVYGWCPQGGTLQRAVIRSPSVGEAAQSQRTTDPARVRLARGRRKAEQVILTKWAQNFDACIECGTTERPHRAHGRCKRCDDRWRYSNL